MAASIALEDLEIYQLAFEIGEFVWKLVDKWQFFEKKSLGVITANIAEGYGRFFYKDRKQFCYYSRESLLETKTWATKAHERKLISPEEFTTLIEN